MTSPLRFWKMSGAGNDFVVVDGRQGLPIAVEELARLVSPRRFSVGADGLLVVTDAELGFVRVAYRNADGSDAGFCGNGARCVARFAHETIEEVQGGGAFSVAFAAITVEARCSAGAVAIELDAPRVLERRAGLDLGGVWGRRDASLVLAGVRHLVVDDVEGEGALEELASALARVWPECAGRVNVTASRVENDNLVHVRTLELGAGLTLACGSAAIAMAATHLAPRGLERAEVVPPSGVPLVVTLDAARGRATLAGEARRVYVGTLDA